MSRNKKIIFFTLTALGLILSAAAPVYAQVNVFGGQQSVIESALGLGAQDPRVTAAKIIRVALGFLGIIAIGLALYGGFLWMTSGGDASRVEQAKKILINAGIGLLIILSAWGIVTFILGSLISATGGTPGGGCTDGDTQSCGCFGTRTCVSGSWGLCVGSTCPGTCTPACGGATPYCCASSCQATPCSAALSCDNDANIGNGCGAPGNCSASQFCNPASCTCAPLGGLGDPCSASSTPGVCLPDNNRCAAFLACDTGSCVCDGAPIIEWISPVDSSDNPNGAPGNFVTIGGRYFGAFAAGTSTVYFADASGSTTVPAQFPNSVNPACTDNWTDNQIIAVVPAGAHNGPIRIVRADGQFDRTDLGVPAINDFAVNAIVRPGLCLANPAAGKFNDNFNLQGANLPAAGRRGVYFGNPTGSTSANNILNWTARSVDSQVPNIRAGANTVFAAAGAENSNLLRFTVEPDVDNTPVIDRLDPPDGPVGQYVTIYGRNFKNQLTGVSRVQFSYAGSSVDGDFTFPSACLANVWRDKYIVVKVPAGLSLNVWRVTVTNRDGFTGAPADFTVTGGSPDPGLCALVPHNGPVGQTVELFGDHFGSTQGTGFVRFYNNVTSVIAAAGDWSNQRIKTSAPVGAASGPVLASDGANDSNTLPFMVGKCSASSECDGASEECCTGGSFDGLCRASGSCGGGAAGACTFGWTFTTGSASTSTSCRGFSNSAAQCLAAGSCPNSPGQCQSSTGAVSGDCGDAYCGTLRGCGAGCNYDTGSNRCVLTGAACDETNTTMVAGQTAVCRKVGAAGRWQIDTRGASCPLGSFLDTNKFCTVGAPGSPAACDICPDGLACQGGQCAVNRNICPAGSNCDLTGGSPTENKCVSSAPTCECCCRVADSAQDCCAGLTCEAGGCGADPTTYGLCTGCEVLIGGAPDQAASDAACNCKPGGAARTCDLTDPSYPSGVCRDAGTVGSSCSNGGACTAGGGCASGLFCDPAAATPCTCQPVIGAPCDRIPSTPSCQPDSGICTALDPTTFCDPASGCTCQALVSTSSPGASCIESGNPSCSVGVADCGADYQCLSEASGDCRCCCVPGTTNSAGLECLPDKSPCAGGTRGLFCGCKEDTECGAPDAVGCSSVDSCCHDRPEVLTVEPEGIDTCRNPMVMATFNQPMDVSSFSGELVLLGDYGADNCPAGTNYQLGGTYKKYDFFGRLWFKVRRLFAETAQAVPGNFCAITGLVKGYNNAAGQGVVTFTPGAVLDPERQYFVIIKGDNDATATSAEGVLSRFGVGLRSVDTEEFNGVTYRGRIWAFTTKPHTADDDGICRLNSVTIDPASYLYQKPYIMHDFAALARSSAGEAIAPIPAAYEWTWDWTSENPAVARVASTSILSVTPSIASLESQNNKDGKTYAKVTAKITADTIDTPSTAGQSRFAKARIYTFYCENPWPPVIDPSNWPWRDSGSNCDINAASCPNNNFELYYCRDSASVGTANDLPAIYVDPVVRGSTASPNQPLKELFFLRENLPQASSTRVDDQLDGRRVYVSWGKVAGAASYKVYYGVASGNYTETIEAAADGLTAPDQGLMVSGLTTGRKYYFNVTAIFSASRAESKFFNEVSVTVTDRTPPLPWTDNLAASSSVRAVDLAWNKNNAADLAGYYIYYGAESGSYGTKTRVDKQTTAATIKGLTAGTAYYFMVGAFDASGNVASSTEVSATPN